MKKELYNLDQYEDILTKEQMRIVCHISKRKAMYLLQSGLIPCINTGKKTHTYLIKKTDIENYLRDREVNPWRYAVSYPKQASATDRSRIKNTLYIVDVIQHQNMWTYYNNQLIPYPALMNVTQVKSFTGYGENTIRNWINKGILRYLDCIAGWRIPKTWLLQFLCSEYYNKISRKTPRHLSYIAEMLRLYA